MCRTGGRRCPGEHDPAKVAARNARRRAKYAADKAQETNALRDNPRMSTEQLSLGIVTSPTRNTPFGKNKQGWSPYQKTRITGTVDYTHIGPDSYKAFGFKDPQEQPWAKTKEVDVDTLEFSAKAMKRLKFSEKVAISQYTKNGMYSWVNAAAYSPEKILHGVPYRSLSDKIFLDPEEAYRYHKTDLAEMEDFSVAARHITMLKRSIEEMDSAIAKAPKGQKIVYHGIHSATQRMLFNNMSPREWAQKNRAVGTELVFHGYTSTSASRAIALNRSRYDTPVVYEILTPEGLPVAAQSEFASEEEILLPREQRYVVVGLHEVSERQNFTNLQVVQLVAINSRGEVLDGTNSDPIKPLIDDNMVEQSKQLLPLLALENCRDEGRRRASFDLSEKDAEFNQVWEARTREIAARNLKTYRLDEFVPALDTVPWSSVGESQLF